MIELNRLKAVATMLEMDNVELTLEDKVDTYVDNVESKYKERDLDDEAIAKALSFTEKMRENHHNLSD